MAIFKSLHEEIEAEKDPCYRRNTFYSMEVRSTDPLSSLIKPNKMMNFKPQLKDHPYLGIFYAFLSNVFMTLSNALAKKLAYINSAQLSLVRNAFVLVGVIPIAVFARQNMIGPKGYRSLLSLRALASSTALYLSLITYQLLPIAEAAIILSTTPAIVMVGARIFLKESCGIVHSWVLILTILGVLLSVRIPLLLQNRHFHFSAEYVEGLASATCAIVFMASSFVFMRKMRNIHFSVPLMYLGSVGALVNAILMSAFDFFVVPRCGWDAYLILIIGVCGLVGFMFMNLALQVEAAGIVSVVNASTGIVMAFVYQLAFFGVYPDAYSAAGSVLVAAVVSAVGLRKWLQELPKEAKARKTLWFLLK